MTETEAFTLENPPLEDFINQFNYGLVTLSIQPERDDESVVPSGEFFTSKNRVRPFKPSDLTTLPVTRELQNAQQSGCAVYFMMNEGNGIPHDPEHGNLNCGRRTNVTTLRTLAIDTDSADPNALLTVLKELKLLPHFIVQTSPGKFHFYFLINPVPAEGDHILHWKAVQKKLASLVPNLDQSLCDINQVLRLPTYINQKNKNKPFKVTVFKKGKHEPYDLKFLYDRLGCFELIDFTGSVNGNGNGTHYNKFTFPEQVQSLSPGDRRNKICSYIEHVMENVLSIGAPEQDYWTLIDAFIIKYCRREDAPDFLPGGRRRQNIEQYFNDQRGYRLRKIQTAESLAAVKKFDHLSAVEDNVLPDTFYLNFPGDLGFLTRELHSYAPNLSIEIVFAAALCISGQVKSELFKFRGYWPMINGLVIASTGAGKSTLKYAIEQVLKSAGFLGQYPQLIDFSSTVQSLHRQLYAAGGVGTMLVDESGDYLRTISAKNAPGYVRDLRKYYKEATTGPECGNRLTPGRSLSFVMPPIEGGFLSLWMFIQPDMFSGSLSVEDMRDGFLPRFLTFRGKTRFNIGSTLFGERTGRAFEPSMDMKVWLESYVRHLSFSADCQLDATLEKVSKDALTANAKTKAEVIRTLQMEAVHRLRSEARRMGVRFEVSLSSEGDAALRAYMREVQERAEKIAKENDLDLQLDCFVRIEEMVARLICNAATLSTEDGNASPVVPVETVEAVIRFHRFQTDRFFGKELADMGGDREIEHIVKAVLKACSKKGGDAVTVKEVSLALHSSCRPKNVALALKEAARRGEVWEEEREHRRAKGKKIVVYRPAVSEDEMEFVN